MFQSTAVAGQMVGLLITPLLVPAVFTPGAYLALAGLALTLAVAYMATTVRRTKPMAALPHDLAAQT